MGVLAANGTGLDAFWSTLVAGQSGIGPITLFDASDHVSQIAGEVKNFTPSDFIPPELKPKRLARTTQLALAAVQMAIKHAHLRPGDLKDASVLSGVSYSALDIIDHQMGIMSQRGPRKVSSHVVYTSTPQSVASAVCDLLDLSNRSLTISSACAAGLDAIGLASELILSGQTDIVIALGADAPITPFGFASFASAGISAKQNKYPEKASRPFDKNRETGCIAEGAGAIVLENLDHAQARGVPLLAEVTGYAANNDHSGSIPCEGLEKAIIMALANASKSNFDIDYICAHGPGHRLIDQAETAIVKNVFGPRAYQIPMSSIKGVVGNPLAAAGPMQVIATVLAMMHNIIPPTANLEEPDDGCDLDYVSINSRYAALNTALINGHGVGGTNSCVIIERI